MSHVASTERLHSVSVESLHMQSELGLRHLSMSRKKTWSDVRGPTAPPCGQTGSGGKKSQNGTECFYEPQFSPDSFPPLMSGRGFPHRTPKGQTAHKLFIFTRL